MEAMLLEEEFKLQDEAKRQKDAIYNHKKTTSKNIYRYKLDKYSFNNDMSFDQCPICSGDKHTNGYLCRECCGKGYLVRQKVSLKPFSPRIENVAESRIQYRPSGSHAPGNAYGEHPNKTAGIQMVNPMQVPDTELEQ
jgi:hypothetical protein